MILNTKTRILEPPKLRRHPFGSDFDPKTDFSNPFGVIFCPKWLFWTPRGPPRGHFGFQKWPKGTKMKPNDTPRAFWPSQTVPKWCPGSHFWVRKWPFRTPWGSKMLDFNDLDAFESIFVVLGTLFGSFWGPWVSFWGPKTTPNDPPRTPEAPQISPPRVSGGQPWGLNFYMLFAWHCWKTWFSMHFYGR